MTLSDSVRVALVVCALTLVGCAPPAVPQAAVPSVMPSSTATPRPTATVSWWGTPRPTPSPQATGTATPCPNGRCPTSTATPTGTPRPPTATPVVLSNKILFLTDREGSWWSGPTVWMMDADGSNQRPCPDPGAYRLGLEAQRWSPDHAYRTFVGPDAQIHVEFPQDGSSWEVSRTGSGIAYDPAWSPVDDRIAFVSTESGDGDEIYTIRSDGSDLRRLTHNEHLWDKFPTWSPDGRQIAFWSNRTGSRQIWVMEADGTGPRNPSQNSFNDWEPVWLRLEAKG
jgi:hypothetical protein